MATTDYIYRRSAAGQSALEADTPLATPLRRVLALIEGETHSHMVRKLLRDQTESNIAYWLSQLEKLGLLEARSSQIDHDLDFTGSFAFQR
jgi:hypothetical protein